MSTKLTVIDNLKLCISADQKVGHLKNSGIFAAHAFQKLCPGKVLYTVYMWRVHFFPHALFLFYVFSSLNNSHGAFPSFQTIQRERESPSPESFHMLRSPKVPLVLLILYCKIQIIVLQQAPISFPKAEQAIIQPLLIGVFNVKSR